MKKFFFIVIFVFSVLSSTITAYALTISPIVLDFNVSPGSSQEKEITLFNETSQNIRVRPVVFEVSGTDKNGFPQVRRSSDNSPINAMIVFPQGMEYIIASGERKKIPLRISASADMKTGGYYGVVSWGSEKADNGVAISGQPGVNLAVVVLGNTEEKQKIIRFSLENGLRLAFDSTVYFEAAVENQGVKHIMPKGMVEIRSLLNKSIVQRPLLSQKNSDPGEIARILPGTTRALYAKWDSGVPFGIYRATVTLTSLNTGGTIFSNTWFVIITPFATVALLLGLLICSIMIKAAWKK